MALPPSNDAPRVQTAVTCTGCGAATTVPFTPTPGRPVFCRACFAKQPAGRPAGPPGAGGAPRRFGPPPNDLNRTAARKRMLAQGRKAHFVYDVREVLARGKMVEENRRVFIEMLFIRGARQSTEDSYKFLEDKVVDGTITDDEAVRIGAIVDRYSFWR